MEHRNMSRKSEKMPSREHVPGDIVIMGRVDTLPAVAKLLRGQHICTDESTPVRASRGMKIKSD